MTKVASRCFEATGHTTFICDFSPPRSGDVGLVKQADLDADFISVAYNPGASVRVNAPMLAAAIQQQTGKETLFTLATRDMNRLALQSLLLGAQLLGLENVVVVQGDHFGQRDRGRVKAVDDITSTGLIASIAAMNRGMDFRESRLRAATEFCIGATVDLSRGLEREADLARRKVDVGAQFLITQPIFDPEEAAGFWQAYQSAAGEPLDVPVFFGLQVLEPDGIIFSTVPEVIREQLSQGRQGVDIALELYQSFQAAGLHNIYLVPPIRRGGVRNYEAAQEVLRSVTRR